MSIRRNTVYNIAGAIIPLALSLVTVPIYLELIGEARYGVLAVAWLLLGYFGLFDLGLGRATAQRIAVLRDAPSELRAKIFWTALILNVGLGVAGGLLIWPAAFYFFGHIFKVDISLRPEILSAVPWLIIAVPMATLSGVLTGALQGREKFLELNFISAFGTILFQLLPLGFAAFFSVNLGLLLPVALLARLCTTLMLIISCRAAVFKGFSFDFSLKEAGLLLRFGGWVTVTSFVGPMMVALDRFIIGAVSGAKAVSYYTVPFQLSERSTILSGALTSAMFPRFATIPSEQKNLTKKGVGLLAVIMTPLVACGIFLMKPFLSIWISPEFAQNSALVGQIIILGSWVNNFARIPYAQLQGGGRPDLVAKCHLGELLPYFGLLFFGLKTWGLVGAALAFTLRAFVDFGLLAGLAGILPWALGYLSIPVLLITSSFLLSNCFHSDSITWFVTVSLYLVLLLLWAWRKAPNELRSMLLGRSNSVLKNL